MVTKPYFIVLEGIEGVGKSTILAFIAAYLAKKNIAHVITREPGGTEIAEAIRQVLLKPYQEKMVAETELLLMFASRKQHVEQKIKPALAQGQWVVCDRFVDSSFAYQGGGRQISMEKIATLATWALDGFHPDLTILLDAPTELGFERIKNRLAKDRIEQEDLDFFQRVRDTFLQRANANPKQYQIIAADQPLEQVQNKVAILIDSLL